MLRIILFAGAVFAASPWAAPEAVAAPAGIQMQAQRGGAMTPQRARRECWQSFGVAPNTPRSHYPTRLQQQVEVCVAQKMRR